MTTISKLYQQLNEGVVTRENFMRRVRNEYSHMVSPTNSFDDAIRILKNKGVLTEAHQLSTTQILDRLNPYAVKKGIEVEMAKCKGEIDLEKIREKVAKNLSKNHTYYEADQFPNAKQIDKHDSKQEMRPVKKELVDKDNAMRKPKGYSPDKANTKASKKENRKGKPKGVKLMKEDMANGQLPQVEDYVGHDVFVSIDPNTNQECDPPIKGTVLSQHGNILEVDFGNGNISDVTISVTDKAGDKFTDKAMSSEYFPTRAKKVEPYKKGSKEMDDAWKNFKGSGNLPISNPNTKNGDEEKTKMSEIVSKLKEYLSKKKQLKREFSSKTNKSKSNSNDNKSNPDDELYIDNETGEIVAFSRSKDSRVTGTQDFKRKYKDFDKA